MNEKDKESFDKLVELEMKSIQTICDTWKCQYVFTNKEKNMYATFDGIFIRDNSIKGFYEVKVRRQTLSWFKEYKSILVSYNKITSGQIMSKAFNCSFFMVIRTSCNNVLVFKITDDKGNLVCPINVRYTKTQKSSTFDKGIDNKKISTNAYLLLEDNPCLFVLKDND